MSPAAPLRARPLAGLCLALALGATALAFAGLDRLPFWVDEAGAVMPALGVHFSGLPVAYFDLDYMPWQIQHGLWDPATPLYRYALAGFTAVAGFDELTTRAFSLLMGCLAMVPLFALVRRVYGERAALLAVAFTLASPTWMVFAREARHFTFVLLWVHCALYAVYLAGEDESRRARWLWFAALVAALLSQTLAYALVPVVALYALLIGPARLFDGHRWWVYGLLGGLYGAIVLSFWESLPFFHETSCENRPAGCQESPWYYAAVLLEFLRPMQERHLKFPHGLFTAWPLSLGAPLFAIGLCATCAGLARGGAARRGRALFLLWLAVPFALLSAGQVKFPRYLFQWAAPLCGVFTAVGVDALVRLRPLARRPDLAAALLALVVVAAPQVVREPGGGLRLRSGLAHYAAAELFGGPDDNFERMRWQVEQLAGRVGEEDAVVTSYDDASLQFYLDRPVYGFLSSRRSDAFLYGVLEEARASGATVWFVDTLPRHDYCLSDDPEPRQVPCAVKFRRFYEACVTGEGPGAACERLPVPRWER